jgi:DNA-binding NtrC family response regulator
MTNKATIWVVDDDDSIRWVLDKALSKAGYKTVLFNSADDALQRLDKHLPEVIVTDIRMPGTSGLGLLDSLRISHPEIPVIIMTVMPERNRQLLSQPKKAIRSSLVKPPQCRTSFVLSGA